MKRWFGKLGLGSVFVLVGVAALAGGALSLATRDDTQATARQSTDRNGNGGADAYGPPWMRGQFRRPSAAERRQRQKEMQQRRKQFESELADELGVSRDKVHTAFRNVMKKHLDQAVEDGRLTRKQADKILECFDGGTCDAPFGHGGPPGGPGGFGPGGGGPPM